MSEPCRGIEIEPGVWSGCVPLPDGTKDCPMCDVDTRLREIQARCDSLYAGRGYAMNGFPSTGITRQPWWQIDIPWLLEQVRTLQAALAWECEARDRSFALARRLEEQVHYLASRNRPTCYQCGGGGDIVGDGLDWDGTGYLCAPCGVPEVMPYDEDEDTIAVEDEPLTCGEQDGGAND